MVALLLTILACVVVLAIIAKLLPYLGLPEPFPLVVLLVLVLVILLWLAGAIGPRPFVL